MLVKTVSTFAAPFAASATDFASGQLGDVRRARTSDYRRALDRSALITSVPAQSDDVRTSGETRR